MLEYVMNIATKKLDSMDENSQFVMSAVFGIRVILF